MIRENAGLKDLYEFQKKKIRQFKRYFLSKLCCGNLNKLALIHKTDKGNQHAYTKHYDDHFRGLRKKKA